jgi:hypothetical protein
MNELRFDTQAIEIGRVLACRPDGLLLVLRDGDTEPVICNHMETADCQRLTLRPEDVVVVAIPPSCDPRGVILGRLGPSHAPSDQSVGSMPEVGPDTPDELVLEAKRSLTLRVGSGSITIREDGKILIKGKDLVSHATRLNRIKGGAVQIN